MARTWLVNARGIARKVKNANRFSNYQIKELGIEAHRECPSCNHIIDNSDVSLEWPGLPAGVKFDPTDIELLEHLAGKTGLAKAHMFIDEFIPTVEDARGICYTHPENLPGVKKDGSSIHFFHRISNAYATGHRKRRKIGECNSTSEERVRWHKTGKTKPVMENGVPKGWKKIMVLYRSLKKGCKPDKANWVMHQYHLGIDEDEKDGELVVSKIFYQQNTKLTEGDAEKVQDSDVSVGTCPTTPKTVTPELRRAEKLSPLSETHEYNASPLSETHEYNAQKELHLECEVPPSVTQQMDNGVNSLWLAGESQAVEEFDPTAIDESLLCHEVLDSFGLANPDLDHGRNDMLNRNAKTAPLFSDLDNIIIDTPPDFQLADLQFGSQDSISSWLDRL
ncbi:uncharacterized protein A4U43_C09F16270 [Asparagus officinalis]|uniref:NAC domain-containing protein n=1 Tax=Asparagus officinalis TaxID=4686 RepID=A0A5P1E849_ASPOF|nr:SUPPRESSOR OF GAMMA RESPONSE 1-like [Asparagus officinalis]ONK58750.1 uncharacterized protein A4U43_C09F16270 [Asparagus officinalis]